MWNKQTKRKDYSFILLAKSFFTTLLMTLPLAQHFTFKQVSQNSSICLLYISTSKWLVSRAVTNWRNVFPTLLLLLPCFVLFCLFWPHFVTTFCGLSLIWNLRDVVLEKKPNFEKAMHFKTCLSYSRLLVDNINYVV